MSTIYIVSDNGKLKKKDETIHLEDSDGTITILFPYKTEQLIIMGNVEITSPALKLLMKHNIDTIFLSKNGRFNGKLVFQESKNVFLRQKQYRLLDNEKFKESFARDIARGKLKNQLAFMQRINRKGGSNEIIKTAISRMKRNIDKLEGKETIDQIRGMEGMGARLFFSVFKLNIIQDWAEFKGRSMHPPKDNVNAVLSFLYTLIFFRIDAIITAEGLDGYAGYFHALDYGRRSLSFDLMEEFRTPIADTLTCALFNLGILHEDDFREVDFSTNDTEEYLLQRDNSEEDSLESAVIQTKKGVLLTKGGVRKVITHFEKKLETQYYYEPLLKRISYKKLFFEQVKHFKRVVAGEEKNYRPMIIK